MLLIVVGVIGIAMGLWVSRDTDGPVRILRIGVPDAWIVAVDSPSGFSRQVEFIRYSVGLGILGLSSCSAGIRLLCRSGPHIESSLAK